MGLFLLIVLGLIAWFVVSAVMKANGRMAYADQKNAERELKALEGEPHLMPSWAMKPGRLRDFFTMVSETLQKQGMPKSYIDKAIADDLEYHRILHLVTLVERRKGGMTAQFSAAADYIWDKWVTQELRRVGLPTWAHNKAEVDAFIAEVGAILKDRSIAPSFSKAFMAASDNVEKMMQEVTKAEEEGGSREDQVMVAALLVIDRWERLPSEEQDSLWVRTISDAMEEIKALVSKPIST